MGVCAKGVRIIWIEFYSNLDLALLLGKELAGKPPPNPYVFLDSNKEESDFFFCWGLAIIPASKKQLSLLSEGSDPRSAVPGAVLEAQAH